MDDTRVLSLDNWQMAVLVTKIYNTYLRIRTFGASFGKVYICYSDCSLSVLSILSLSRI